VPAAGGSYGGTPGLYFWQAEVSATRSSAPLQHGRVQRAGRSPGAPAARGEGGGGHPVIWPAAPAFPPAHRGPQLLHDTFLRPLVAAAGQGGPVQARAWTRPGVWASRHVKRRTPHSRWQHQQALGASAGSALRGGLVWAGTLIAPPLSQCNLRLLPAPGPTPLPSHGCTYFLVACLPSGPSQRRRAWMLCCHLHSKAAPPASLKRAHITREQPRQWRTPPIPLPRACSSQAVHAQQRSTPGHLPAGGAGWHGEAPVHVVRSAVCTQACHRMALLSKHNIKTIVNVS
jgi:hypothetical protein